MPHYFLVSNAGLALFSLLLLSFHLRSIAGGSVYDFELDLGAIPDSRSVSTALKNSAILQLALQTTLQGGGNTVYVPPGKVFYLQGGIQASNVNDATLHIDGTLKFIGFDIKSWPMREFMAKHPSKKAKKNMPHECIELTDVSNFKITSTTNERTRDGRGIIDGSGPYWWGIPILGYIQRGTMRPHLLYIHGSETKQSDGTTVQNMNSNIIIENIVLKDSPRWTAVLHDMINLKVRDCSVVARRTPYDGHSLVDMSAFNTDGFDISGHDVHVHDVDVWNQDDWYATRTTPTAAPPPSPPEPEKF